MLVMRSVLLHEEYSACAALDGVRTVIDCGGNIGCAALYFLKTFPCARVCVIEPDEGNLAICRLNLDPYGGRVRIVAGAVWPVPAQLRVERTDPTGPPLEWAYAVREAMRGESADVQGIDLESIRREVGADEIDLLKIDIEGGETALLSHELARQWLDRTRNLVIELHGPASERAFDEAMAAYDARLIPTGEYVLCAGLRRKV